MVPAIYDKGTHYVINHKLTFQMLKEISDSDDVLEVAVNIPISSSDVLAKPTPCCKPDIPLNILTPTRLTLLKLHPP